MVSAYQNFYTKWVNKLKLLRALCSCTWDPVMCERMLVLDILWYVVSRGGKSYTNILSLEMSLHESNRSISLLQTYT